MPTLHPCIIKAKNPDGKLKAKADGTFNIFIRLTHKRKVAYLETPFYANRADLDKSFEIKEKNLLQALNKMVFAYHDDFKEMGLDIYRYTAAELKKYLVDKYIRSDGGRIDFIAFGRGHIEKLKKAGRESYSRLFRTTLNGLIDFFGKEKVYFNEITSANLLAFEKFLSSERKMVRENQGKQLVKIKPGISATSIKNNMVNIRTLFNEGIKQFNDREKGQVMIAHYPFGKYEMPEPGPTKEKGLEPDVIRQIRDFPDYDNSFNGKRRGVNRADLGRDIFMLIIYLLGINTADLYTASRLEKGRLVYNRVKTKHGRKDNALMSVLVPEVAQPLFEKYRDKKGKRVFNFYHLYANANDFNRAVGRGLKVVAEKLGLENLTTYYARYSFATIARNNCGFSLEDVAEAMNHSSSKFKITDIYIRKTWDRVDKLQKAVLMTII